MSHLRRTTAVVGLTALIASAGASPVVASQPAPFGGLQPGVRYVAADSDLQRIEFYVVDERGGGALLAMSIAVTCDAEFGPDGNVLVRGVVDADGRITAKGRVATEAYEDNIVRGPVKVSGELGSDGAVTGTVDFELTFPGEDSCERPAEPWRSSPVADPGVARILGRVPVRHAILDASDGAGLAATEDAVYALTLRGERRRLHRLDPTTGDVEWSVDVEGADSFSDVVTGAGLVWVTAVDRGDMVVAFDPADGDQVGEVPGFAIAFGPDGVGWAVEYGGDRLRRIEGRPPKVTQTFQVPDGLQMTVAAGAAGVYVAANESGPDAAIARIDPESGEVAAMAAREFVDALLVDEGSVWVVGSDANQRLDPVTLEQLAVDQVGNGTTYKYQVAAPPGVWLSDFAESELVLVLDAQLATAFSIPFVYGPMATARDSVWILDPELGLRQMQAG